MLSITYFQNIKVHQRARDTIRSIYGMSKSYISQKKSHYLNLVTLGAQKGMAVYLYAMYSFVYHLVYDSLLFDTV